MRDDEQEYFEPFLYMKYHLQWLMSLNVVNVTISVWFMNNIPGKIFYVWLNNI